MAGNNQLLVVVIFWIISIIIAGITFIKYLFSLDNGFANVIAISIIIGVIYFVLTMFNEKK